MNEEDNTDHQNIACSISDQEYDSTLGQFVNKAMPCTVDSWYSENRNVTEDVKAVGECADIAKEGDRAQCSDLIKYFTLSGKCDPNIDIKEKVKYSQTDIHIK